MEDWSVPNLDLSPYTLKLGDFGLARDLVSFSSSCPGAVISRGVGTRGYTAPETHTGLYGALADVFSAGVVIRQLATGKIKDGK